MSDKIKILTISDHPLSPSGVGTQTKYMIDHLLSTGRYQITSLGGAVKHKDYRPQKTEQWGDDWVIVPVDAYANPEIVRSMLRQKQPDIVWFMTDPRFYGWLWDIENEVRKFSSMVYYHVWDNTPYPSYNRNAYLSNDKIVTISKVTDDIVKNVTPEVDSEYLPHSVDMQLFSKKEEKLVEEFRKRALPNYKNETVFFWNSRNARRKMSGSVLWWFAEFLDEVGRDKARLVMHTDPKDKHGPDLEAMINELGLTNGEIMFSTDRIDQPHLAMMYNMADCTIGISDAEGFGLSTFESLACETPILVNMTGGLQEQVTDGEKWFGVGIEPASKAVIGSQQVPFIYEDRVSKKDFIKALKKFHKMKKEDREKLGKDGREHLLKNYNPQTLMERWDEMFQEIVEKNGTYGKRKNYKSWELREL